MIVCCCFYVNEETVIDCVKSGCVTMRDVCTTTGAGLNCGKCRPMIQQIINYHKTNKEQDND